MVVEEEEKHEDEEQDEDEVKRLFRGVRAPIGKCTFGDSIQRSLAQLIRS